MGGLSFPTRVPRVQPSTAHGLRSWGRPGSYLFFFLMYKTCKRGSSIRWPGKEALINPAVLGTGTHRLTNGRPLGPLSSVTLCQEHLPPTPFGIYGMLQSLDSEVGSSPAWGNHSQAWPGDSRVHPANTDSGSSQCLP